MSAEWWTFVVSVVISGVVGGAIAQTRNTSVWEGFCWGFVLGPIGWAVVGFVLKKKQDEVSAPPAENNLAALSQLADLLDRGALTQAEFDEQKRRLLSPARGSHEHQTYQLARARALASRARTEAGEHRLE